MAAAKPGLKRRLGKFFCPPYKNLQTCSIASSVEKNSTVMERVKAQRLHVCYRKVFIKSVTYNQYNQIYYSWFLRNYTRRNIFSS
jgi:hypothetical protein